MDQSGSRMSMQENQILETAPDGGVAEESKNMNRLRIANGRVARLGFVLTEET